MSSGAKNRCLASRAMHTKSIDAGDSSVQDASVIRNVRSGPRLHAGEISAMATVKTTRTVAMADAIPRATPIWVWSMSIRGGSFDRTTLAYASDAKVHRGEF